MANPDADPDFDAVEAIAWLDPTHLAGNPAVRPELLESLDDVLAALGCEPVEAVEKAGDAGPKDWPGWRLDERTAAHWAPLIAAATSAALTAGEAERLAHAWQTQADPDGGDSRSEAVAAAALWLAGQGIDLATPLADTLAGLYADAYLVGATSAHAVLDGGPAQVGGWKPGDTDKARSRLDELGAAAGLEVLLAGLDAVAQGIADSRMADLGRALLDGEDLRDTLADPDRAAGVAMTEVTRGSSAAAMDVYAQRDVARVQWVTDPSGKVCPRCQANADAGSVPRDVGFPGGDPPLHPRCRCSVVPA